MASPLRRREVLTGVAAAGTIGIAGCSGGDGGEGDGDGSGGSGSGGGTTNGDTTRTVTIGNLNPTSGPYGFFGNQQLTGLRQRVERYNDSDEDLPDTELEVVARDTEGEPSIGNQAARELILQENVDVLNGTVSSSVSASVLSVAAEENVPFFMTGPTDRALTSGENCEKVGFRWGPHSKQLAPPIGSWSIDNHGSEGYVLVEDYAYGNDLLEALSTVASNNGASIAGQATVEYGTSDFQAVIEDAKSVDPDWFFLGIVGGNATSFLSQAADRGFDIPITSQYLISPLLGQLPPEKFEQLTSITTLASDPGTADIGTNLQFREDWTEAVGSPPLPNHYMGYNNATFVGDVIDEADDVSTEAIVSTAEGFTVDALFGEVHVRECDHQAGMNMWIAQATEIDSDAGLARFEYYDQLDMSEHLAPCSEIACDMN